MKIKKLILLSIICLWAAGCTVNDDPMIPDQVNTEELRTIRVAVQQYYVSAPIGYIVDQKLDEAFGLKLELVEYQSGADQILDIEDDIFDVATIGAAFLYPAAEDKAVVIGEHIRCLGGNGVFVRKDSPLLQVKGFNPTYPDVYGDLETVSGSLVLLKENTTLQYIGMKWLESIGVKNELVTIEDVDFEELYSRYAEGYGDVALLAAPSSYQAEKDGYVEVAGTGSLHTAIYEVLMATKKAHEEKYDDLVLFLQVVLYANELLENNFGDKLAACESWYSKRGVSFTKDILKRECKDKIFVTRQNYEVENFGEFAMKYAEYMAATGNIPAGGLYNIEKNIDREMFRKAFEQE